MAGTTGDDVDFKPSVVAVTMAARQVKFIEPPDIYEHDVEDASNPTPHSMMPNRVRTVGSQHPKWRRLI